LTVEPTRIARGLGEYLADLLEQIDAFRDPATSLALTYLQPTKNWR
jgi:hypothetical protein